MNLIRKNCCVCFRLVMVDSEFHGEARCARHGGTTYMQPISDKMLAEVLPTGLIRVSWKAKVLTLLLPSEAEELAKLLLEAVETYKQENQVNADESPVKEEPTEEEKEDTEPDAPPADEADEDEEDDDEEEEEAAASE
jgi:hypothetical protein